MKSILGLAALIAALVLVSFYPLAKKEVHVANMDDIAGAMRSGNAGQLSRFLDTRVDISLPDKSDTYSKSQAEMIIRDFFTTNGVQNFILKHKKEDGGSEYCMGVLQTQKGDFRTTLFIKMKGERQLLQELRFQSVQ